MRGRGKAGTIKTKRLPQRAAGQGNNHALFHRLRKDDAGNGLTYEEVRHNEEVRVLIEAGNESLRVRGFTDHGYAHAGMTAKVAGDLLETLGYDARTCELARIAGYMHDIGNAINRSNHAMSGALLAFELLRGWGVDIREATAVMTAIGNHDEGTAAAVTPLSAALILADKSDVRRAGCGYLRSTVISTFTTGLITRLWIPR